MAAELTKLKRKWTSKRNVIIKNLLKDIDEILSQPFSENVRVEGLCLLESLSEVQLVFKELDELIIDKIEVEEDLEKDKEIEF